ncbi:alpha/beta hydrolase family protein [Brevundimonas sp. TWP2-3-4b1]|uniref:alpha/beta hydrolase family protein n=1 Tax=Brevundimonas sp. TWP2-3-4b1 TaxID=2804580 RepID=UPI003CEC9505
MGSVFSTPLLLTGAIAGLSWIGAGVLPASAQAIAPEPAECPASLPEGTTCSSGRSPDGAWFWIARPRDWNGTLIVHAHGGPRTAEPLRNDPVEDLERFSVMVNEGYAWAGSTYRRGGYGVRMAARDTDDLRQIVWDAFGKPKRTLLHGQSWGGNVAAKAAELYAVSADGERNYDGVILTSGLLAGGTRGYAFRADLRAIYQFYCRNHPRPTETQYPLWQGLPEGAAMPRADIAARVEDCTGLSLAPEARTRAQADALRNILSVVGVTADSLVSHLAWGTNLFQDMVWERLDGGNPFSNAGTTYQGSDNDVALNQGVERFEADPAAVAALAYDADLTGAIVLPTLTLHARYDPTVFVEHEAIYAQTVAGAGRSNLLSQVFTTEALHSQLSLPQYAGLLIAMTRWLDTGEKPDAQDVVEACQSRAETYGQPCLIDPDFVPTLPN